MKWEQEIRYKAVDESKNEYTICHVYSAYELWIRVWYSQLQQFSNVFVVGAYSTFDDAKQEAEKIEKERKNVPKTP